MADQYLTGWSGVVESLKINNSCIGYIKVKLGALWYDVYFNQSDLYINGEQCNSSYRDLSYYAPPGTAIHFDAMRFRKPVYNLGYNVWYQATLVWIGRKPVLDSDSEEEDDDDSCDYNNIPDVDCQYGEVVQFVNKNLAVVEFQVNDCDTLVAIERCRYYLYDADDEEFYQPDILKNVLDVGDMVHFEAFLLNQMHPSGVQYRVGLAWEKWRPDYDLNRPTHVLKLPTRL